MKRIFLFFITWIFFAYPNFAQQADTPHIPMIGETAPAFKAISTKGNIDFPADYYGKWTILFSHPAAFTPVCTSELLVLSGMQEDFKTLNTDLLVISTDGLASQIEWVSSMENIQMPGVENHRIEFPVISDTDHSISNKYGMIHPYSSSTRDVRGVFIIDPEFRIRALFFYPSVTGRNLDEIMRVLQALQLSDKKNVLTPANWKPGDDVLMPPPQNVEEARKMELKNNPKMYSLVWYMWYLKKP